MSGQTLTEDRTAPTPPSPPARRLGHALWLDPRLIAGVALLLGSVVLGARLFAEAGHTTLVWAAAGNLAPGQPLTPALVVPARVGLGGDQRYYVSAARPLPAGYVVTRAVGAHELLPFAALAPAGTGGDTRVVAVPVQVGHLDPNLAAGGVVDVYATARAAASGSPGLTRLVLAGATVISRSGGAAGLSGSTVTVLLSVPAAQVPGLVQAVQAAGIDLVDVPAGAR